MANFFDRLLGRWDEEAYDDFDEQYDEQPSREELARSIRNQNPPQRRRDDGRVVNFKNPGVTQEVIIIEPRDIATAQQVCDFVRSGKTVICNIERIDPKIAQRVIDFLTGATYALAGSVEPISSLIFVVAPRSTQVSNADQLHRIVQEQEQRYSQQQDYRNYMPQEDVRRPNVHAR